ncbi:FAD-dependent oxidoreductase [Saccharopolyspora sp. HNM0983]|uniref:FAD-dependent oxidoreductase n=1 Tax=Saccharopolyspora montiporae TaxID=2781240 RepID=A0A929G096_9PSEU|nr:FAD-dependent oxidoreductase [Saccharopolyspora sp. HNM0983]
MTRRIVVVGAGYAGVVAAHRIAARSAARVTVLNEREHFVERVRLHQCAAGQQLRARRLGEVVGPRAEVLVGRVAAIEPEARNVRWSGGGAVGYDLLVLATGSVPDVGRIPGAAENACHIGDLDGAVRARGALAAAREVLVLGGGLTGIEAATELATERRSVRLVSAGPVGADLSARGREHLARVFARRGIRVHEGRAVRRVRADGVELADGARLSADVVLLGAGFTAAPLAAAAGLAVDSTGRALVDAGLRSISHPEIHAAGDAAHVVGSGGEPLRMACAVSIPAGRAAADAVLARIAGRPPEPFRFGFLLQCISLGRRDALVQPVRPDDSPRELVLTGRPAAVVKETIVRGAATAARNPVLSAFGATGAPVLGS